MKRLYLILGEGGTRKSATVRCLTGIRTKTYCDIRLATGSDIKIWAWMRAAQEMGMDISNAITDIASDPEQHFLLPLRIHAAWSCPDGIDYINAFISHGFIIVGIAIMGINATSMPHTLPSGIPTIYLPNSRIDPANANAHAIRPLYGWM